MHEPELLLLVLMVTVGGLGAPAGAVRVPYPIVLVLGGLVLGFVPGVPPAELEPDLVLVLDRRPAQVARRVGARQRLVIGWSRMRGAVSLAAALALPLQIRSGQDLTLKQGRPEAGRQRGAVRPGRCPGEPHPPGQRRRSSRLSQPPPVMTAWSTSTQPQSRIPGDA